MRSFSPCFWLSLILGFPCAAAPSFHLHAIVRDLPQPTFLEIAPGERTLYVGQQSGKIVAADIDAKPPPDPKSATPPNVFLDIEAKVESGGEMGLLGLAFHPQYARNRKFYLNYTVVTPKRRTVIAERTAGSQTERELLTYAQPYVNHKGGQLAFGPDHFLYIATGDGGYRDDPHGNGQKTTTLLGKILRIDVDRTDGKKLYGSPGDNPFANGGGRPEIFAYGLRNPWRFSFDRTTGALFAGDVGQNTWEEIDIVEKGGNYGWNVREGAHCFSPKENCPTTNLRDPIFDYGREQGISITGGYVYRGTRIPELAGAYIYGDFGSGRIWALRYDQAAHKVLGNKLLFEDVPVSTFGEDADGEILVAGYGGTIYRIEPTPAPAPAKH